MVGTDVAVLTRSRARDGTRGNKEKENEFSHTLGEARREKRGLSKKDMTKEKRPQGRKEPIRGGKKRKTEHSVDGVGDGGIDQREPKKGWKGGERGEIEKRTHAGSRPKKKVFARIEGQEIEERGSRTNRMERREIDPGEDAARPAVGRRTEEMPFPHPAPELNRKRTPSRKEKPKEKDRYNNCVR